MGIDANYANENRYCPNCDAKLKLKRDTISYNDPYYYKCKKCLKTYSTKRTPQWEKAVIWGDDRYLKRRMKNDLENICWKENRE